MGKRIAIIGAGAVGGYVGAHMVRAGEDVVFIDPWPANVAVMRRDGLRITHLRDVPAFVVPVRAVDLTEVQAFGREAPFDIVFQCMKSYDTEWATLLIRPFLAPGGYVVSLQNCINEETIAGVVGWGRTLGCIASSITVELCEAGHVRRAADKSGPAHVVFRVGEVHGRETERVREVCRLVALADTAKVTDNLWGERWSKLVANVMGNGLSACTGLVDREIASDDGLRRFSARLGSEAIRVGQALGYQLEAILHLDPEIIARAGEGDAEAAKMFDDHRLAQVAKPGGGAHRPSMGQDIVKGRKTEIEFLNGLVAHNARNVGMSAPANAALTDIVTRVERGDLKPDRRHVLDLRLN